MALGRTELPHQMKDEDLWFRLTKPQLFKVAIVTLVLGAMVKLMFGINKSAGGISLVVAILIFLISVFSIVATVPENAYLLGIGTPIYRMFFFWIKNKMFRKEKKLHVREYATAHKEVESE